MPLSALRIAWLVYRGNPHCGGQGVYTRYLAREVTELGHQSRCSPASPSPSSTIPSSSSRSRASTSTAPRTRSGCRGPASSATRSTSREFAHHVRGRVPRAVHVQPAGPAAPAGPARRLRPHPRQPVPRHAASLGMIDDGWPVLRHAAPPDHRRPRPRPRARRRARTARLTLRRWYGFLDMQMEVARQIPRLVTVSESSQARHRRPDGRRPPTACTSCRSASTRRSSGRCPHIARVPGRLMTTASADVPMKGLAPLLEALAKVRAERPDAHLVVIGKPKDKSSIPALIERLGLADAVEFVSGVTTERIVELYAEAEVAVRAVAVRGLLAPRGRGHGVRRAARRHHRRRAPRGRRPRRRDRAPRAARRPVGARRRGSSSCSATPSCGPASARRAATACSTGSRGARPPSAPSSSWPTRCLDEHGRDPTRTRLTC